MWLSSSERVFWAAVCLPGIDLALQAAVLSGADGKVCLVQV